MFTRSSSHLCATLHTKHVTGEAVIDFKFVFQISFTMYLYFHTSVLYIYMQLYSKFKKDVLIFKACFKNDKL